MISLLLENMNWLEIKFWKVAIWIIKRGYGTCEKMDYEEFEYHPHELNAQGRCPACQATEVIKWIEYHLSLLERV